MKNKKEAAITIDPAKTALLLIHWQNDITGEGGKARRDTLEELAKAHTIEHTQAVLKATREKGMLVVYITGTHRPGYPELPAKNPPLMRHLVEAKAVIRGTWGAEVIDQLKPLEDEIIVHNFSTNGFYGTDLDVILRNKGITDLVISGVATNFSVESTARDGCNRGYFIHILSDCCNSFSAEMHNWTLTNFLPYISAILDSKTYIAALQSRVR
jgi:nicotinamidase-related amidase